MMRNSQVYISGRTKGRLRLLANVTPSEDVTSEGGTKHASVDEIADKIINDFLVLNYPEIQTLEKEIEKLEEETACRIKERNKA